VKSQPASLAGLSAAAETVPAVEGRLAVQYTVTRVLAESPTLQEALPEILRAICGVLGWQTAAVWKPHPPENALRCIEFWPPGRSDLAEFEAVTRERALARGVGLPGRVWATSQPAWIPDVVRDGNFPRAPFAAKADLHSAFGFPVVHQGEILAVMEFFSRRIENPDPSLLEMLAATGNQIGQFIVRKEMEQALRDSEALYHSLVETLPICILRKDLQGHITFGNQTYSQVMGKPLAELVGKSDFDFFPKELAEKYVADDRRVIQTRQVFEDVEEHQRPDGSKRYMHVLKAPVIDARDAVVGTQTIFWDETARREAEEALAKTAAELKRSNRELELFAHVASHDLQEPLRTIASYTRLLARRYGTQLDSAAAEYIQFSVDGALRMQELLNDLLEYSRVNTRAQPLEAVDAEKVLADVCANLKLAIEEAGAIVTHDRLPVVMADATQLMQLLQNLIANAIKFRGPRRPAVHVGARPVGFPPVDGRAPHSPEWMFSVEDNGIGIEPAYYERIFVIFQRLHTRDEYPGTGLGLALCKKIVERHGGRIWVESTLGRGSKFFFTLAGATPSATP
jgi:PAS domain S-box-containing protein